jgi:hypothetical protein
VSHVLNPSLVVNAFQTASIGAGTVTSKIRALCGAGTLVTETELWARPNPLIRMHPITIAFIVS